MTRHVLLVLVLAAIAGAAGCAQDPRYSQGLGWVVGNEAQKKQLENQGFPQYTNGPG